MHEQHTKKQTQRKAYKQSESPNISGMTVYIIIKKRLKFYQTIIQRKTINTEIRHSENKQFSLSYSLATGPETILQSSNVNFSQ